ncbi:preprotein translocase subunit SecG [Frisingicoccus caecimuris]|jgi:preprotein translocase subunit SecG|uniref:Protein-export membrane protein SecG n=1 Tax=Frisingicoccus caecimuris TaxID=1796636 RepID=A0A4V2SE18_9FIRM|nr:preprotein translocase subunit SecG [Frisingicoccus caecimuris]MCR1918716.1 preprotein translocase subunit SecG [Frisingicoccus caecimuris]TCO86348.1 preprotein translocase subunit SecG [Frisingicoccus caecimuris]
MLRTIVTVVFIAICIALVILVMLQESKSSGFTGTVGGMADSYWGKNKGRSMEGKLVKWTTILTVVFFVLTVVLNMNW